MNSDKEANSYKANPIAIEATKLPRAARIYSESSRSRRFRGGCGKIQRRRLPSTENFEGATPELKGHYFDINYNQSE